MIDEPPVLTARRGQLGSITLNRPRSLNALTHEMVRAVVTALDEWRADDAVAVVTIDGAGERGLCAGGDVLSLYRDVTDGDGRNAAAFWRDEYRMNSMIARYPKPIVAIQDGIVLGGGMGISAHASHRVVTERSRLGFPEVAIGFVPDVGASWLLSRAGSTGTRLALTGESVGPADAIELGLADHLIDSADVAGLLRALEDEDPAAALARIETIPPRGVLGAESEANAAFTATSVREIVSALHEVGAGHLADVIDTKSPLAVAVARESLARAVNHRTLEEALETEFRVSVHALRAHDFAEGVRAQLVDKDKAPRWSPPSHHDVTPATVSAFFDVVPANTTPLVLPQPPKDFA
ncbi:enoyl-CoA hydratase/isomerase family protein [Microbacterium koreense]|uniref:3-hydroxyisobutyryl-CoA hydrolase n=1 Tax=Microbacterium koreense TaxID=323761 RepID=A0ABW2ZRV7_9MICO